MVWNEEGFRRGEIKEGKNIGVGFGFKKDTDGEQFGIKKDLGRVGWD